MSDREQKSRRSRLLCQADRHFLERAECSDPTRSGKVNPVPVTRFSRLFAVKLPLLPVAFAFLSIFNHPFLPDLSGDCLVVAVG